jgi:hypothetical protein
MKRLRKILEVFTLGLALWLSSLAFLTTNSVLATSLQTASPCHVFAGFSGASPDGQCGQMTITVICDDITINCTLEACDNGQITSTCSNY